MSDLIPKGHPGVARPHRRDASCPRAVARRGPASAALWVWVLASPCVAARAGGRLEVRAAYFRVRTAADPGSATMLVRNPAEHPLRIDGLLMDGTALPAHGIGSGLRRGAGASATPAARLAAARIVWAILQPNPIPPGRSGWLYVQLHSRPAHGFRLALRAGDTTVAEHKLLPIDSPVRIANVAFPSDLSRCLVYVANTSPDQAEDIRAIELNEADATDRAWVSSRTVAPRGKELIVVDRPGLAAGEAAMVLVTFASGRSAVARVRALPVFPVALREGGPEPSLGITEVMGVWPVPSDAADPPRVPPEASCVQIFRCPSHVQGADWQGCAAEILRRRGVVLRQCPRLPAFDAVCRARASVACCAFAHTTDAGYLNPYLPRYSAASPRRPVDAVDRAMAMCRAANAPDPVFAVVPAHAFHDDRVPASPDELRRLVYGALAGGARGILYRLEPEKLSVECEASIRAINDRLQRWKPLLLLGEPVDWAACSGRALKAQAVLAGDQGLVLFVLNRGGQRGELGAPAAGVVTVRLPEWVPPVHPAASSDAIEGSVEVDRRRIRVAIERLHAAAALVFRRETPGSGAREEPGNAARREEGR